MSQNEPDGQREEAARRDPARERIDVDEFQRRIEPCKDVLHHMLAIPAADGGSELEVVLYYCDGMIDGQMYQMVLLPMLEKWREHTFSAKAMKDSQNNRDDRTTDDREEHSHERDADDRDANGDRERGGGRPGHPGELFNRLHRDEELLFERLFAGSVILIFNDRSDFYEFNIANLPARQPEESTMELSLKGPRDGFVEKLSTNVALVRMRMRTPNMHVEYFVLGKDSRTEVALIYMIDQARPELIDEARRRLLSLRLPDLKGAGELEELLSDRPRSFFPLLGYVGRPDFVSQSLMKGRFAVLTDGSPSALIGPGNLTLLIKSPEDAHLPFYYVSLERALRLIGLFVSMFLPGFWVAVSSFNTDQMPFTLLATVTMSRIGLPISATMEMFLMLGLFELFREAGVRLPRPVGQTVSVVGGLIIGDAAIRAGMTSPTMLVVAAVSAVSTFTLVNQSLAGSVSVIRFLVLIAASTFGMYGFFIALFAVILYMCSLESFGQPYMAPLAPIQFGKIITALFQKPQIMSGGRRRKP